MNLHLTPVRALAAYIARRAVMIATVVFTSIIALILVLLWLLSQATDPSWWLLAIPLGIVVVIFMIVRGIILGLTRVLYRKHLTRTQRQSLARFIQKILSLRDARATSLQMLALITVKDLLLHRDARTLRAIIANATSLRSDYLELESTLH